MRRFCFVLFIILENKFISLVGGAHRAPQGNVVT